MMIIDIEEKEMYKEMYDEASEVTREERLKLAADFLEDVLLPAIERGEEISEGKFNRLVRRFKEAHSGPGSDFEIGHIWGMAYRRALVNKCLALKGSPKVPADAAALDKALDLLTELM
jgi:hypothetical protein